MLLANLLLMVPRLTLKAGKLMARIATGLNALQNARLLAPREQRWFFITTVVSPGSGAKFTTSQVLPEGTIIREIKIRSENQVPGNRAEMQAGAWLVNDEITQESQVQNAEKIIDWGVVAGSFTYQSFGDLPDDHYDLIKIVTGSNIRLCFGARATMGGSVRFNAGFRFDIP